MNKFADYMLITIILICMIGGLYTFTILQKQINADRDNRVSVLYDCRVSEISPDIPPAVKEECRKRMDKK